MPETIPISISLFGVFEVSARGQSAVTFRTNKSRALLAYLLMACGQPVLRTTLIELLWPGYTKKSALASLRQTITDLRTLFAGTDLLQADYHTIQLKMDPAVLTCDAHSFDQLVESCQAHSHASLVECPVCRARLTQALALYKGSFMQTLPAIDSRPLNEWLQTQRMRYEEKAAHISTILQHGATVQAQPLGNLPAPLTPLIGRADEMSDLADKLLDPVYRCLTLIGPGGIGKTRLALALGTKLKTAFPDGVWFVDLGALAPAQNDFFANEDHDTYRAQLQDRLAIAMIKARGLALQRAVHPAGQLLAYVQDKSILFILDNFEHLSDGVGLLAQLLKDAPDLRFLVTSRHGLDLQGQQIYRLDGLTYPIENVPILSADEMVARYASLQLFLERAALNQTLLVLDKPTLVAVTEICQIVEGMPLMLELAATLLKSQEIDTIAQMIRANYQILKSTYQDLPSRQRTAQAVLRTDWQLLTPQEAQTLARCTVFQGGFSADAADHVVGATRADLSALIHKSLLQQQRSADGATRYRLHELVRQFAAEQLAAHPAEMEEIRDRHAAYYLKIASNWQPTPAAEQALRVAVQTDRDNVEAAWRWTLTRDPIRLPLDAVVGLVEFYEMEGAFYAAEAMLEPSVAQVRSRIEASPPGSADDLPQLHSLLAHLLMYLGYIRCFGLTQLPEAQASIAEALTLAETLDAAQLVVRCYNVLMAISFINGDYTQAQTVTEKGLRLAQAHGLRREEAMCLNALGTIADVTQDFVAAQRYLQQALAIAQL